MFGKSSPPASDGDDKAIGQSPGSNTYHPGSADAEYDELHVQCPSHTTERKMVSQIDWHLMPFICVRALYLLAFLDRVNIANANSLGMAEELGLEKTEYNTALTIFFVPYIVFEIPSNILLKRLSPRIWLPTCMLGFGVVSIGQGFVKSYSGLLATRFFLGLFETGMFPGCFYLLGMWYRRSEAQKRYSLFFSSTSLAGAFGGLLASGLGKMDGLQGISGWRWVFIIEGVITGGLALFFYPIFPTFPEEAKWLSSEEQDYVKARLQVDQGRNAAERKVSFKDAMVVMKDYRIWLGGFMYLGLIVPAYGYAYFAPQIIGDFGYDPIKTQLWSVPPWAASFTFSLIIAFFSDLSRHRALFTISPLALSISGFAILLSIHDNTKVQYAALCLVTMGTYGAMPIIVCWFNMNLGGHHRRSIGTAWQIGFGNIGGIIATYSFLEKDAPRYVPGYSIAIAFTIFAALSCTAYLGSLVYENRKREKTAVDVGLTDYEKTELGDLNPEFKYMY